MEGIRCAPERVIIRVGLGKYVLGSASRHATLADVDSVRMLVSCVDDELYGLFDVGKGVLYLLLSILVQPLDLG